jgi:hypothetical protein
MSNLIRWFVGFLACRDNVTSRREEKHVGIIRIISQRHTRTICLIEKTVCVFLCGSEANLIAYEQG